MRFGAPAVLAAALCLSACGSGGGSASPAGSASVVTTSPAGPSPSSVKTSTISKATSGKVCGDLQMKGNTYKAVIVKGHPKCPDVIKTFDAFFAAPKKHGKATVSGWTCGYESAATQKKTKNVAICTKKSEEIAAKK